MTSLVIQLLGGFRARLGETELQFPTKKAEALLAFLACPPGRTHSREKLAALFWGDSGEEQARQSLRQTLFTLRKIVNTSEEIVVTGDSDRIGIDSTRVRVDAVELETLLDDGSPETLARAVELYAGDFLDGLTVHEEGFESWVALERERLRERALSALSIVLEQQTSDRLFDAAVQTALRILSLDPLRESTHRALMRLYVHQGRRESALKQYHACTDALRRQLQVEPEDETRKLFDEIRAVTGGAKGGAERTRILLVEDNLLNRQLVISMLDDKKYEIVIAEDGAQALLHLGNRPFDLILLDIKLPNIDGLTLLKVIRENGYHTPTILMTAMPGSEPEIRGLRLGAADFVRKPLQKSVLVARIQKALGESGD